MITLPESPAAFKDAKWQDILPYYQELVERPLDRSNVETWLEDWSRLESMVGEAAALANFAYSVNTADPKAEEAQLRFGAEIDPAADEQRAKLQARLVELDYVRPGLEMVVRRFANQIQLFREENVPLQSELAKLTTEWAKVNGALTVEWEGVERTPAQLLPYLESNDRDTRERAFRARAKPYVEQRDTLAALFDEMYDLRQKTARNAGFDNYRDYVHREKNRFDYTPEDCMRFHDAVEKAVLPSVTRIWNRRHERMGLDRLRPWDLAVDDRGREPLKPFDDVATLVSHAGDVFGNVDPDFRSYFESMRKAELLDLENRKGKRPGAFCDTLPYRKMPLILMNAVGVDDDIRTLLHESGHAFHSFEAARIPLVFQRFPGSEMAEVASMSMELLASPFITRDRGGYYTEAEARRSTAGLLERAVIFFTHCASVDAFQHWIYSNPKGRDADARDRKWLELRRRFEGEAVDWSGLDAERIARWYLQPHFFAYPFYYIEYGIAQLGALQVWRNSLRDHDEAVRQYRQALALGATAPLPDLFAAAGARLIFDADGMGELVDGAVEEIEKLDG